MNKFSFAIIVSILVCFSNAGAAQTSVVVKHGLTGPKDALTLDILKLAFKKSGTDLLYRLEERDVVVTEARLFSMVRDGESSLMWAGVNKSMMMF